MTDIIPFISYSDADDRAHPLGVPGYYEWWYNDFRFDNNWAAVVVFHISDWLKKPRVPSVEISIYDPDGKRYYHETVASEGLAIASESKCDVRIGDNRFWQEGEDYHLKVTASDISADLNIHRIVEPLYVPPGLIYADDINQHYWCVPVPRGDAQGVIVVEGRRIPVSGIGYHDHNWGSCDMNNNFGGWTWGHFFDPVYSGIFSCSYLINPGTANSTGLIPYSGIICLARYENIVMCSEKIEVSTSAEVFDVATGQIVPGQLLLSAAENNCSLTCRITIRRVVERDNLKFASWNTHNWRFLDDYRAQVTLDGNSEVSQGQALHERFMLRLK